MFLGWLSMACCVGWWLLGCIWLRLLLFQLINWLSEPKSASSFKKWISSPGLWLGLWPVRCITTEPHSREFKCKLSWCINIYYSWTYEFYKISHTVLYPVLSFSVHFPPLPACPNWFLILPILHPVPLGDGKVPARGHQLMVVRMPRHISHTAFMTLKDLDIEYKTWWTKSNWFYLCNLASKKIIDNNPSSRTTCVDEPLPGGELRREVAPT